MSKFKYIQTFLTKEGAEHYKTLYTAIGYDVRIVPIKSPFRSVEEYTVYQTIDKVRYNDVSSDKSNNKIDDFARLSRDEGNVE